jgi:hypothetical protein
MLVLTCASGFDQVTGQCIGASVWVEIPSYPQPVLPPLTLAEGTFISFAIVGVWTVGLKARLVFKASRS